MKRDAGKISKGFGFHIHLLKDKLSDFVEAFAKGDFICSIILAGVTSELAHKTRLHEQGAKIKRPNGRPKSWKKLIDQYGKSDEIKLLTEKSKMTIEIFGFISATTNLNCFYREKASQ
ncbi:MAG: hypothetical protein QXQ11_05110 [Candidatus Bathyarchaeia archaeon]